MPRVARPRGMACTAPAMALVVVVLLLAAPTGPGAPGHHESAATVQRSAAPPAAASAPAAAPSGYGDWPTYMANPERTGANANESVLAVDNASALHVLWNATVPGTIQDTPVVSDGTVFVSSWDGSVSAFNLTNGTLRWRTDVGTSTFSSCNYNKARGPTSTPTVVNGTVYILGGDPYLYALSESNGSVEWKVAVTVNSPSSGDYNWGSPLIYDNSAYFGVASACGAPGAQGMIEQVNLNGTTHGVVHTFAVVPSGSVLGGVWSTPAVDPATNLVWVTTGDGTVSSTYGQSIVALNATTLRLVGDWQVPVNCCDYDFGAGPTLFRDAGGHALVGALNKDGVFYTLNRSNVSTSGWAPVWADNISWYANTSQNQPAGSFDLGPAAFDGATLYVGGGFARLANGTNVSGTVRAIAPGDGAVLWTQPTRGYVRAGLAWADGLLFDAALLPNYTQTSLEVRAAATGALLYRFTAAGSINGAPSVANGIVLFGTGDSYLSGNGTLWALALPLADSARSVSVPASSGVSVGFSASPTGGVPPYVYDWAFGDGTPSSAEPAPTHLYERPGSFAASLVVTDAADESLATSLEVTIPPNPVQILLFTVIPTPVPVGTTVTFFVSANGGFGNLTYLYTGLPPGCASRNATTFTCVPSSVGSYLVGVTATDRYGDGANETAGLSVIPQTTGTLQILAFFATPDPIVLGNGTRLTVVLTGGTGPVAYRYGGLPPGCASENASALDCTPAASGTYGPTVTATDATGTSASATLSLSVAALPTRAPLRLNAFLQAPTPAVVGENLTWIAVVDGGSGTYSYTFTGLPTGCGTANESTLTCVPTAPGSYRVQLNVTDTVGDSVLGVLNGSVVLAPAAPAPAAATTGPGWVETSAIAVGALAAGALVMWWARRGRRPT